jgi:hypothetical protein
MNQLLTLGFIESATAEINDNNFRININKNEFASNILYAFVVVNTDDISNWLVRYIGHSRKSFSNRMYGYQQGNGKAVNNRIHIEMSNRCRNGEKVLVYCLCDVFNIQMHGLHVDLAAGLEYSLIEYYSDYNSTNNHPPLQNIAGNPNRNLANIESTELELIENNEEEQIYTAQLDNETNLHPIHTFNQSLSTTYWNFPIINVPSHANNFFGVNGETAIFTIYQNSNLIYQFQLIINRTANSNGSVRFYIPGNFGMLFQNWKHVNYELGGVIKYDILGQNNFAIIN